MKKILLVIILGFLMIGLLAPLANLALAIGDANLNSCCQISAKFSALEKRNAAKTADYSIVWNHKKICIVGEAGGPCVIDGKDYSADLEDAADLKEDSANKIYACGGTADGSEAVIAIEGWGMICLLNTVYTVTNWVFYLMMIAVVIIFVIAGAKYMLSSGDPAKTKSAKNMIIFGIVGLVVALIAKLIPSVVKLIVGM